MDELMKQALEKHKIVRYIPTFLEVMTTYKRLLDAQNEALNKHDVNRSSCKCTTVVSVYKAYECTECGKLVKGV